LFGPETPALFGPLGRHTHVIWGELSCSPCVNVLNHRFSPCNDNVCMQRITVEQVYAEVNDVLRRRKVGARSLPVLEGSRQ
jgi:ADP-heptose:LPS heptosyltransferase